MSKERVLVAEDLILEILLLLPPASIIRFKSVCKKWYSLISNPCFLKNHAHLNPLMESSGGLLLSPNSSFEAFTKHYAYAILPQDEEAQDQNEKKTKKNDLRVKGWHMHDFFHGENDHSLHAFKQKISHCFLIDSCNGLLLYHTINPNSNTHDQYMVFNPIINQYKEVPIMDLFRTFINPNEVEKTIVFNYPHIVFDPSLSLSYKVLTILREPVYTDTHLQLCEPLYTDIHLQLYVYSSDTGSWKRLNNVIAEYNIGWKTFMFDGVFYWLCSCDSICFDVVKESVWFLPLPPKPMGYDYRKVLYFGECGGRLRLIEEYCVFDKRNNPACWFPYSFDIMENELGSAIWTVKFRVNIKAGYDHLIKGKDDPFHRSFIKVMHHYETEKGEVAVLLNVDYERLVSFNITTNTFGKELTIPNFEHYDCLNAFPFTPTLFPLLTDLMNAYDIVKMGT